MLLSVKLVSAYVASDMWEVNNHVSPVNAPFEQKD